MKSRPMPVSALLFITLAAACRGARRPHTDTEPEGRSLRHRQHGHHSVGEANMHPRIQWFRKRLLTDTTARGIYVSLLRYPAGDSITVPPVGDNVAVITYRARHSIRAVGANQRQAPSMS